MYPIYGIKIKTRVSGEDEEEWKRKEQEGTWGDMETQGGIGRGRAYLYNKQHTIRNNSQYNAKGGVQDTISNPLEVTMSNEEMKR